MKVHQAFLTVLIAPLVGALLFLWSIGQFDTMSEATIGSLIGFIFLSWFLAMLMTLVIGFPLGFALSAVLRRLQRESLAAYLVLGPSMALVLAMLLGDPAMGGGFVVTAAILALGYWFFIAKQRVANELG